MTGREWKPGDVAMVTALNRPEHYRAFFNGDVWREHGHGSFCVVSPTDIRPLVVIDPEDREQVERLVGALANQTVAMPGAASQWDAAMQAALRSLIAPPKPDAPIGWGAVVEDRTGAYWTLYAPEAGLWINYREGKAAWPAIDAVRIVSEGVTP